MIARKPATPKRKGIASIVTAPEHTIVWRRAGGFGGWPANHGAWSWGDELLVGFLAGHFKNIPGAHAIDEDKPSVDSMARSLDGGKTWTIEPFRPEGGDAVIGDGIDFTPPDFALRLQGGSFAFSCDRGRSWKGPVQFPSFGLQHLAARTDYIVNDRHDCTVFLSAAKTNGLEGRPFCARTRDGGKTWRFLSWITPEYPGFAIMPSSLRVSNGRIISAIRVQSQSKAWIPIFASDDDGATWQELAVATTIPDGCSNPPSMIRLTDGRLCLTYGHRPHPVGIRTRLSGDEGKTWSDEIVLRADGGCWDMGYVRSMQLPDGRVLAVYYYNDAEDGDRYIAATAFDPNSTRPRTEAPGRPSARS